MGDLPLSSCLRTYWQPPAHPELTFWDWPGAGSPLSVQELCITMVRDL